MSNKPAKRIPIAAAKRIGNEYGQDQVLLMTFGRANGMTHVVTWGRTIEDCDQAAKAGKFWMKTMEWPDELCHDEPSRVKKLKAENKQLKKRMAELERQVSS